ncbi:MAG TPA: peptidylprolyl isomerase [Vicinamibacterales bacterium]|nr:peptidylprolyl isomerase [Vicinamibacterales bacterium]
MTRWLLSTLFASALAIVPVGAQTTAKPTATAQKPAAAAKKPAAPPATTQKPATPAAPAVPAASAAKHGPGVYAHFTTNHGTMVARLFDKDAPNTVQNFVGLAEGKKPWMNPRTKTMVRRPYYNNLTFHRIIPGFMIQGGDPEGTGRGGPGFKFADEFNVKLRHSKPGILSMANAGPNTNGGQFFITLVPTSHLDNRHSVFGELVEGTDVLMAIGKVPTNPEDNRPLKPVVIKTVRIERVS